MGFNLLSRSVFSDKFRARLGQALGKALVCSSESSSLAIIAAMDGFARGRGVRALGALVDNRRLLFRNSDGFRSALTTTIGNITVDVEYQSKMKVGFMDYYMSRLPILLSSKIVGKGRPTVDESSELLKACAIAMERALVADFKLAVGSGLFEHTFAALRQTRQPFRSSKASDEYAYNCSWLVRLIINDSRISPTSEIVDLTASCIDAHLREDRRVMTAVAICDVFPLFYNDMSAYYTELLLYARLASERPFA